MGSFGYGMNNTDEKNNGDKENGEEESHFQIFQKIKNNRVTALA